MPCRLLFIAGLLLLVVSVQAEVRHYRSTDGRYEASVASRSVGLGDEGEGAVEVRLRHGRRCIRRSFISPDGEHGRIVEKATWTPDARFFVFSTTSSGGHSPWHHWTFVWSRRDNQIHSLDDAYLPTTVAEFRLTEPDRILTRLWSVGGDTVGTPFTVRLSRVRWKSGIGMYR